MSGHQTRTGVLAWSSRILSSGSRDRNILQHDLRVPNDFVSKLVGHKSEVKHQDQTKMRVQLKVLNDTEPLWNDTYYFACILYSVRYVD